MKHIKCIFGMHNWIAVARNTKFHTHYTDTGRKEYYLMSFYKCKYCEKRKFTSTYPHTYTRHIGINSSQLNWIDCGVIPQGSIDLTVYNKPKKSADIVDLKIIKNNNDK